MGYCEEKEQALYTLLSLVKKLKMCGNCMHFAPKSVTCSSPAYDCGEEVRVTDYCSEWELKEKK